MRSDPTLRQCMCLRTYRTAGARGPGDAALLDLLEDRLVDYQATVHRTGESGIAGVVAAVLAERGARRIAKAPGLHLELGSDISLLTDDEARSIADAGLGRRCHHRLRRRHRRDRHHRSRRLTCVRAPGAHSGPGLLRRDRPPRAGCRVGSRGLSGLDPRAALTWISGPSATSDIELSRVEGVHGPRTLVVVLVG